MIENYACDNQQLGLWVINNNNYGIYITVN